YAGDLAALLASAAAGGIEGEPTFVDDAAVTVVCAAEGYPVAPRLGDVIEGVDEAEALDGVTVFGAGVAVDASGQLVTAGGRVLAVTAVAPDLASARSRAYEAASLISWPGKFARHDIAAG